MPLYHVFTQDVWNVHDASKERERPYAECPILIDHGETFAVLGRHWRNAWYPMHPEKITNGTRLFRFGEGEARRIMGRR